MYVELAAYLVSAAAMARLRGAGYPARPVTIVVQAAPGGVADPLAAPWRNTSAEERCRSHGDRQNKPAPTMRSRPIVTKVHQRHT